MPHYLKLGALPAKHHVQFPREKTASYQGEGLHYEHVITTDGFDRAYTIMYHLRPPTRVRSVEFVKLWQPTRAGELPLRHHHLKTAALPRAGDPYTGRVPFLFNKEMIAWRCRPARADGDFDFFRNGGADEIIFVWRGGGWLESNFGRLRYRAEDYIVIPRGTVYRLVPDDVTKEDHLILESSFPVRIPARYLNAEGQIRMGAPYSERNFHGPSELVPVDRDRDHTILVKDGARLSRMVLAHHPCRAFAATGAPDVRNSRLCRVHLRAALARPSPAGRARAVGA